MKLNVKFGQTHSFVAWEDEIMVIELGSITMGVGEGREHGTLAVGTRYSGGGETYLTDRAQASSATP